MIIARLIGGLGNQMFQYATGLCVAKINNTDLKLDITGYERQRNMTPREYKLDIFDIKEGFATNIEISRFRIYKILFRIFRKIHIRLKNIPYIGEKHHEFDPEILKTKDNTYIDGYWNSEKNFKTIDQDIRDKFKFKSKLNQLNSQLIDEITQSNSVSLHIRRGDYISSERTNKFHGICSMEYYEKSIKYISLKVSKPFFYIFSDDPIWVKNNLKIKSPHSFININNGKDDYLDMRLMSNCKHNIIANSTFSWWGAWLNNNPDKIVIAPKKWFNNKSINTNDFVPESWIKL